VRQTSLSNRISPRRIRLSRIPPACEYFIRRFRWDRRCRSSPPATFHSPSGAICSVKLQLCVLGGWLAASENEPSQTQPALEDLQEEKIAEMRIEDTSMTPLFSSRQKHAKLELVATSHRSPRFTPLNYPALFCSGSFVVAEAFGTILEKTLGRLPPPGRDPQAMTRSADNQSRTQPIRI
jgi:hypothetical protein